MTCLVEATCPRRIRQLSTPRNYKSKEASRPIMPSHDARSPYSRFSSPPGSPRGQSSTMVQDTPQSRLSPSTQIFVMAVVLTMGNLALTTSKNSRVYLFEQAICSLYYRNHPEEILGTNQPIDEALCKNKEIQHPLSWVVGIDSFLQLLPGTANRGLHNSLAKLHSYSI